MMEAARRAGVKWYLYTSSVGVYHPAEVLKRMMFGQLFRQIMIGLLAGQKNWELQAEAYSISVWLGLCLDCSTSKRLRTI